MTDTETMTDLDWSVLQHLYESTDHPSEFVSLDKVSWFRFYRLLSRGLVATIPPRLTPGGISVIAAKCNAVRREGPK